MTVDTETVRIRVNGMRQSHQSPPIVFHVSMSSLAASRARQIAAFPSSATSGDYVAGTENVMIFGGPGGAGDLDDTDVVLKAVDKWYEQSVDYDYGNPGATENTADFTRLVWRSTKRVGVGVSRSSSSSRAIVVVMAFDPPGNRHRKYASNVLPSSVGRLDALDDFYTKSESDSRFLKTGAFDAYVELAKAGGIEVAESNADALRQELDDKYYRKYYIDEIFDTKVTETLLGFSNLFADDYYNKSAVDERFADQTSQRESEMSSLSNAFDDRLTELSNSFNFDYYTRPETDDLLDEESEKRAALSNHVAERYLLRDEAADTYATATSLTELSNLLGDAYLTSDAAEDRYARASDLGALDDKLTDDYFSRSESDGRFTKLDKFADYSNAVSSSYYDKQVSDARFAGRAHFSALSNAVHKDYVRKEDGDEKYASATTLSSLSAELRDGYYTKSETDDALSKLATSERVDELSEKVYAKDDATSAELSNVISMIEESYFDREASDIRYAASTSFATFSNTVASALSDIEDGYYRKEVLDDKFVSVNTAVTKVQDDVRDIEEDQRALSNLVHGFDFYSRSDADLLFVGSSDFEGLSNLVADTASSTYRKEDADSRFARSDNVYSKDAADDAFAPRNGYEGFSNSASSALDALDARTLSLSNYAHASNYSRADADARFASAAAFAGFEAEVRDDYVTRSDAKEEFAKKTALAALSDRLDADYDTKTSAAAKFAAKSNFDTLSHRVHADMLTKEEADARFVARHIFPEFRDALYVSSQGWVGVGTENPQGRLHVRGSGIFTDQGQLLMQDAAAVEEEDEEYHHILPSFSFERHPDTGMYAVASGPVVSDEGSTENSAELAFAASGKEIMRVAYAFVDGSYRGADPSDADDKRRAAEVRVSGAMYANRYFVVDRDGTIIELGGSVSKGGGEKGGSIPYRTLAEDYPSPSGGVQYEPRLVKPGQGGFAVRRHDEAHVLGGDICLSRGEADEADEVVEQPMAKEELRPVRAAEWEVLREGLDDDGNRVVTSYPYSARASSSSSDANAHWNAYNPAEKEPFGSVQLRDEDVIPDDADGQAITADLLGVHASLDTGTWVAVGVEGTVYRSDDDGQRWERRMLGSDADIRDVYSYGGTWIAVGDRGKILRSADDGRRWVTVRDPEASSSLNPPSSDGLWATRYDAKLGAWFAVGEKGIVLSSSDDGFGWQETSERPTTERLHGIVRTDVSYAHDDASSSGPVSQSTLTLVGDGGTVIQRKEDDDASAYEWRDVSSEAGPVYNTWGVYESAKQVRSGEEGGGSEDGEPEDGSESGSDGGVSLTWVAISGTGKVMWSSDGGMTWSESDAPSSTKDGQLRGVYHLTTTGTWVAVGENGLIVRTSVHSFWRTDANKDKFGSSSGGGAYSGDENLTGGYPGAWNVLSLPHPQHVHAYTVTMHNTSGRHPTEWKIFGKAQAEDVLWTELDARVAGLTVPEPVVNASYRIDLSSPTLTRYAHLAFVAGKSNGEVVEVREIRYECSDTLKAVKYMSIERGKILFANAPVGIGTRDPSYALHVAGDIYATGNLSSAGNWNSLSDARTKTGVRPITGALEKVMRLRGCDFRRRWDHPAFGPDPRGDGNRRRRLKDDRDIGLIAQEVLDVVPEVVEREEGSGLYSVCYGNLVALLVESVKDMRREYTEKIEELSRMLQIERDHRRACCSSACADDK